MEGQEDTLGSVRGGAEYGLLEVISSDAGRIRGRTAWVRLQDIASILDYDHDMGWSEFRGRLRKQGHGDAWTEYQKELH